MRKAAFPIAALLFAACARSPRDNSAPAPPPQPPAPVTFNKDVAPIVFEHCAACHRPGQAAPFTLLRYEDAKLHADEISDAVQGRHMPPWLPEAGYGEFVGERRLSQDQIDTIQRWVNEGAVEGNPADRPPVPTWTEDWQLGQPDLVVTMPRPYTLRPGESHGERRPGVARVRDAVAGPQNAVV